MINNVSCESRMQFVEYFFIKRDDSITSFVHNFYKLINFELSLLFCLPFLNGLSYRNQIAPIMQIFRCSYICFFEKSFQLFQKLRYIKEKIYKFFLLHHLTIFLLILEMTISLLLLAISKRFKLQIPDWTHFVDFLEQINLFF